MEMKTTLAQDCKKFNSSKEIYSFVDRFLDFRSEIFMWMQYVLLQNHVASHRGSSTHFLKVPGACQTSFDALPGSGRSPLESYDFSFKQKSYGARPMSSYPQ